MTEKKYVKSSNRKDIARNLIPVNTKNWEEIIALKISVTEQ